MEREMNIDAEAGSALAVALSQPLHSMSPQRIVKSGQVTATPQESMIVQAPAVLPVDPGLIPTVQNLVSTVSVDCLLDLQLINSRTRNSEYNPKRFCGLVMRIRDPRATALVFSSGKVVVTGVRHESHSVLASRKFARIFQKLGFPVKFKGFKIHNMVATCDLRFPIKLEQLNHVHGQFSSYEPELFPALIYRLVKPRIVLLIFVNGKIVVTGAKSREDIQEGLENMLPILRSFRKQ